MNRLRPPPRIRPIRPYWPRSRIVAVSVLGAVALTLLATAWLQRTEDRIVALDPAAPVLLSSDAGPIEVATGAETALWYRAGWLLRGPRADVEPGPLRAAVALRCDTAFPCRAPSRLALPPGVAGTVRSVGGDISVGGHDGPLELTATGDAAVFLGPVAGPLAVDTGLGGVWGYGLRSAEVWVVTAGGPVDLGFAARPRRVEIRAGDGPVTLRLPPGDYAVTVEGGTPVAVDVGQAATADSEIVVHARGPVRIEATR